ncbi:MAG: hypothetical protein JXQ66_03795 [Campylobacterales bacterium]|nr:hypothetical protein [Campylobacterales bacterium]
MSSDLVIEKLEKIFFECDMHLKRMQSAAKKMSSMMPLDEKSYINLTEDEIEHIDQFLFRFSKLQDVMGQKLFKTILVFLSEDIDGKPFIDILNIMEKLYLLDNSNDWKILREDRNELAHNYENEPENMSIVLNNLYEKRILLASIYQKIKSFYEKNRYDK